MTTKEEIKELNKNEKWWMLQGALIYNVVVGFFGDISIISMLFNTVFLFTILLIIAKLIHMLISKKYTFSTKWIYRLFPTIAHLIFIKYLNII